MKPNHALQPTAPQTRVHTYEAHPRKDDSDVDLITETLPFGRVWYGEPDDAIDYAKVRSRSHNAVIRVYR
jgi:hypothetical protein